MPVFGPFSRVHKEMCVMPAWLDSAAGKGGRALTKR